MDLVPLHGSCCAMAPSSSVLKLLKRIVVVARPDYERLKQGFGLDPEQPLLTNVCYEFPWVMGYLAAGIGSAATGHMH